MKRNEIDLLYLQKKKKGLTNKNLAAMIGCSESLLSKFFNHQCSLSQENLNKLTSEINNAKEFVWKRVEVKE